MDKTINYEQAKHVRVPKYLVQFSLVALVGMGVWANQAYLDEVVSGPGKVVPISQTQVIQSLEGGILASLPVWEGKTVEEGEIVATLSENQFKGAYEELEGQINAIEARLVRLNTEMKLESSLKLPSAICIKASDVCKSERYFFGATRKEYLTRTKALQSAIDLQEQEVEMTRGMTEQDILPEMDLLKSEQALSAVKANLSDYQSEYQTVRSKEYADNLAELNVFKAQLGVREDQLSRAALRAPTRSIVNKINITTIGGVVPAGEPILELTPLGEELRVEAKISPKDVAFIHPGMKSTIKLSAYDYSIYGSLKGKVTHVSADTFIDEEIRDSDPYYKVFIAVDENAKNNLKEDIDTRPGMVADVELHTGSKTVLQYLLKPLFKTKEAFRER